MANRAVKIYNHKKQRDGTWTFVPVDINLDTRSVKTVPGSFKISWYDGSKKQFSKGHFPYLADAIRAGKAKQLQLQDGNGHEPVEAEDSRTPIDVAADAYLHTTKLNGRPGTYALAEHDLREWQEWNRKNANHAFVDEITRDDMLTYRNWVVKTGREARTAVNKTMRVNHFVCQTLKLKAGDGPIKQKDAEKIIVKKATNDVEYYSDEQLEKFFAECDPRQHLIFTTFLKSGCRREEIEFLYWDDLDFAKGTLHVCAKPEFDFTVKTKEERHVPLPMDLVARLQAARKASKTRLVFPTKNGGPLGNSLLVACKRIAKRGGLNCGICPTCIKQKECEHWFLHKFRATFATKCLQAGMDVATLQEMLGHKDLSSTMRYLGNLKQKALRAKVDAVWNGLAK